MTIHLRVGGRYRDREGNVWECRRFDAEDDEWPFWCMDRDGTSLPFSADGTFDDDVGHKFDLIEELPCP